MHKERLDVVKHHTTSREIMEALGIPTGKGGRVALTVGSYLEYTDNGMDQKVVITVTEPKEAT